MNVQQNQQLVTDLMRMEGMKTFLEFLLLADGSTKMSAAYQEQAIGMMLLIQASHVESNVGLVMEFLLVSISRINHS